MMTDDINQHTKSVVKAGAGYIIGNYLLKGITFLAAPIFTRLLTTAEYGDVNTYLSYEDIVYILVGLALHSSINNAKYKYKEKIDSYVSSIVLLILLSASVWLVGANVFFDLYKDIFGFDRFVANILIFHCLFSSLFQVFSVYVSLSYSVKDFLKVTAFNGIANIVVSVILVLTAFSNQRYLGRILGTVIPIGIVGAYVVVFFFRKAKPKVSLSFWRYGIGYSLPIIPHGISQVVLSSFDRIMIRDMVGSAEAGIYSFAGTILSLFRVASTSLENVWKPWVYERMSSKDYDSIKKQGSKYAFGMALFVSLIMLASPELIKIMGDVEYWQSTPCVIPVVVGGYFAFLYSLPSLIEYYYEKTKYIAIGTMTAAIVNVVLNYLCIKRFGYIAAAYTTLVTYVFYFLFHYFMARKIHGNSVFDSIKLLFISLLVILVGGVTIIAEKYWLVRWTIAVGFGIFSFIWVDKEFDAVKKVKEMLKWKR